MTTEEATLGIPQLDRIIAPIPSGSLIVLANDPGLEPIPFTAQTIMAQLSRGRDVVYVVTNRSPAQARDALESSGAAIDGGQDGKRNGRGAFYIVDAYAALLGSATDADYIVPAPADAEALQRVLEAVAVAHPGAVLIIDELGAMADMAGPEAFAASFPSLAETMRHFACTMATFTVWPYAGTDLDAVLQQFDAQVRLRGVEERVRFSQYFSVAHANWRNQLDTRPRLYKVDPIGGVMVYIPKIVVTGPHNAGKSTMVQSISDRSTSADRLGTTVALDHGHVSIDGLAVDIYGTPGQQRFDPIVRTVAGQALGVLLVVDATKPDTFERAKDMMQLTWRMGVPIIVAANKQDRPGALAPPDVAKRLGVPSFVQVIGCTGNDERSARMVLRALLDQIMEGGTDEPAPRADDPPDLGPDNDPQRRDAKEWSTLLGERMPGPGGGSA